MRLINKRIETIQAILIAIFAALILRQFVIAAYKIPTGSMENTLLVGDFLLVNKFVYGAQPPDWIGIPFTRENSWGIPTGFEAPRALRFRLPSIREPRANDIIVFRFPRNPQLEYIKRCIAVGGDTVEIRGRQVFRNGALLADPPHVKFNGGLRPDIGPIAVDPGHYFMMGDNRDDSYDSRQWGFVPRENVVGQPLIIYLSVSDALSAPSILNRIRWERLGLVIR